MTFWGVLPLKPTDITLVQSAEAVEYTVSISADG